jgi:hypothetical protein
MRGTYEQEKKSCHEKAPDEQSPAEETTESFEGKNPAGVGYVATLSENNYIRA